MRGRPLVRAIRLGDVKAFRLLLLAAVFALGALFGCRGAAAFAAADGQALSGFLTDCRGVWAADGAGISAGSCVLLYGGYTAAAFCLGFVGIGVVNTLTTIVLSHLLSGLLGVNVAYVVGYLAGFLVSYLLNSRFTFLEKLSWGKLVKYAVATVPNFLIQNGVVFLVYNILDWHHLIASVLAAAIGVPVTFILQKFFTFKK